MKPAALVLGLSLSANAALALAWWWPRDAAPAPSARVAPSAAPAAVKVPTREEQLAAALAADPEFAAAIKGTDPKLLREALIRAGFPADYVRDMVTFSTGNTVSPEHLALLRAQASRPFWQTSPRPEEIALKKFIRERDEKNNELTKAAFGGKIPPHPLEGQNQRSRYSFLPEEKIAAVLSLDATIDDRIVVRSGDTEGGVEQARERALAAKAEKREALVKLLTPAELELYDLHLSGTAQSMRQQLALFQATEAEFKAIYEVRRPYDEQNARLLGYRSAPPTQDEWQRMTTEQKVVEDRLTALLGAERYGEYTRAQNEGYRAAVEIAAHYNLPPTAAAQAYTVQQSLDQRWQEGVKDTGGRTDSPAITALAATLLAESDAKLTALLGPAGYDAYKKTGGRSMNVTWQMISNPSAPRR